MNAGAGGIERELADRNAHAVGAEIAEAQDALAIGHDDQLGTIRPVGQDLGDSAAVVGRNEQAARALEDQSISLAGKSHRRRVDQRLDFVDMVANDAEEQRFVAIMQRVERDVFLEIAGQAAQIGQHALDLRLHRQHGGGQEAAQAERVALLPVNAVPLLSEWIAQQREAPRRR